jgi:hypothetical protein
VRASLGRGGAPAGFDTSGSPIFRVAGGREIRSYVAQQIRVDAASVGVSTGTGSAQFTTPFYARPQFSVSHRGTRIASLVAVYDGPQANTMRMVVLNGGGDTVYARHYAFTPEPIPRAVADSALAAVISRSAEMGARFNPEMSAMLNRAIRDRMKIPPVYAPFTSMIIADDGTAWIGLRSPADAPSRYMVLDAIGNVTGVAAVPPRVRPVTVTASQMWGVELDQNDVPSVVRYSIAR